MDDVSDCIAQPKHKKWQQLAQTEDFCHYIMHIPNFDHRVVRVKPHGDRQTNYLCWLIEDCDWSFDKIMFVITL